MKAAPLPVNEQERLAALRRYDILDTPTEQAFDDLTQLTSYICDVPIALVSLIDANRQWFKSRVGLGATETPRDLAFCAHAILQDGLFIVPDATKDERFHDNPLVAEDPSIRFYAGAPLVTPDGFSLGTLCAIDRKPRELSKEQAEALRALGRRVVAELELRQRNNELRLAHAKLAIQSKKLEQSNEELQVFAHVASHDLQEPLRTITGFMQLLLARNATKLDAESKEYVDFAFTGASRMSVLIRDMLKYTKVGNEPRVDDIVSMKDITSAALSNLHAAIQDSGAKVELGDLPDVRGDPSRISQLMQNLIGNAIKFRKKDEAPVIEVAAKKDKDMWRFSVRDNGIGIDPKQQKKVFEVFSRLHNQDKYEGSGIGLSICQRVVEQHGGRIWVESEPGSGSTFFFTLPTAT